MSRNPIEIVGGSYDSISSPLSCQRTVNWVPCLPEAPSLADGFLDDPSGIIQYKNVGSHFNRGGLVMNNVAYFVNGTKLYSVNAAGYIELGTIGGSLPVSMATNGSKLVIVVPGGSTYVYDKVTGLTTQITDPNFISSSTVVFIDGYFVFSTSSGDKFFNSDLSALNSPLPLTFDPLSFGKASISPDKIVGLHVSHNELYVIGEQTIELFQDTGGTAVEVFPFQRIPGATIQKGCYAKFSVVDFNNTFLFLGGGLNEQAAIWMVTGSSSVKKVSNAAIELALQQFTLQELNSAYAFTWSDRGSYFAAFTIRSNVTASKTFVYDSATDVWHERQTGVNDNSWRVTCILSVYGLLLCGDIVDGRIGYMDKNTYQDYGEVRFRMRTCRPFFSEELPIFQGQMELTMETGVGITASNEEDPPNQGQDPQIRLSYSDNGGRTWSYEMSRSYGKIGEFFCLPTWRRLGLIPRHRVLRFISTEPVKTVLIKLTGYIDA